MDVSVIIVNYNTKRITADCIQSIFEHTKAVSFEVILIDNNSTDGSKDLFQKDARIKYVYNSENIGFGNANNIGYNIASGKYIFLLNSDTILLNDAISIFFNIMQKMPQQVACIGTILRDVEGNNLYSFGPYLSLSTLIPSLNRSNLNSNIPEEGLVVPVIIGADLFIRKCVIEKEGFFDPIFFMYHEENDLQRRFHNAGYESRIVKGPKIIHLEGKSSRKRLNSLEVTGAYTYVKKWLSHPQYIAYKILYPITRFPKCLMSNVGYNERINYFKALIGF